MRYALLGPSCAFVLGAAYGHALGMAPGESAIAAAVFTALGAVQAWRRKPGWALACFSLACAAGGAGYATARRPAAPANVPFRVNEVSLFEGCVTGPTEGFEGAQRVTVEIADGMRMNLSQGRFTQRLEYGERIRFRAAPRIPRSFANPGSFDYAAWLAARGIYWQARLAPRTSIERLPGRCGGRFAGAVQRVRAAALDKIDKLYAADGYRKAMMKGLLLGEESEIRRAWVEGFRRTGTYHALVISGSHVAFVAGIFLLYLRRFRYGESTMLLLSCLTAWSYALIAGGDPPVTRTAAGFTLAAIARWHCRRVSLLHILATVAVIFVVWEPWQVAEAGFQLSFMAVAAIGAVAAPWLEDYVMPAVRAAAACRDRNGRVYQRRDEIWMLELRLISETAAGLTGWTPARWRLWIGRALGTGLFVLTMFIVSAAIQLALALPMVLYFHRLSVTGLSANVLATPVITFAIPAGFLAILTGWGWAAQLAAGLLEFGASIVAWHGLWEPHWRMPDPPLWLTLAFASSTAALGIALVARRWRMAAFCANLAILAAVTLHPFQPRTGKGQLELAAIDTGQAESLHLALPGGGSMLIDTAGFAGPAGVRRTRLDPGEDVVSPYLWQRGIKRLDAVVISHFHSDHSGGLEAVLRNFRPAELWVASIPDSMLSGVLAWTRASSTRIRTIRRGQTLHAGGAVFEVLAPLHQPHPNSHSNNDSLVLRVRFGKHAFLLPGDIERLVERRLLAAGDDLRAHVLKVPHHGSARSNAPDFLDAVNPAVALVSAAGSDWMRLPSEKVVDALRQRRTLILRTDRDGLVWVRSDGRHLSPGALRWTAGRSGLLEPF
ncbi:MAG: hypothetical protein C0504_09510 [Candidatus Solibacter sp.]|nr:hypothetical protein [Candidatus Solibacter sp.]